MFHGRRVKNKINDIFKRSLYRVYKDSNSSFIVLLKKNNLFPQRKIQLLAIELVKVKENFSNSIINDLLQTRKLTYNLRSQREFARSYVITSYVKL